jgi:C4-dicarboxylate transporter
MERAVFLLKDVFSEIIAEGMEEAFCRIGLIVTAFVFIAGVAAIDEIVNHIRTAL